MKNASFAVPLLGLWVSQILVVSAACATENAAVLDTDGAIVRQASAAELMAAVGADAPKPSGLFMPSSDASVKMKVGGFMQVRYYAVDRGETSTSNESFVHGFQSTRTRFSLEGTPGVKDLTYRIETNADASTGRFLMTDAFVRGTMAKGVTITGGQFKPAFSHEQTVADTRQLAVERSTTDAVFSLLRARGVMVEYQTDDITLSGTFSNGSRTLNQRLLNSNKSDAAITGRFDAKFKGSWDQYKQMTSFRDAETVIIAGLGAHAQWGGQTNSTRDVDFVTLTADAFFAGSGWNVYAAGFWRHTDNNIGNISVDDGAVLAEAGCFVTETVEPFLRYEHIFIDGDYGTGTKDFGIVTPGVNWYVIPRSHVAKFTADVMVTIGSHAESSAIISPNVLTGLQAGNGDPQLLLRVQFQVVF